MSLSSVARLVLIAVSLGLDVFAVCIGVGVRGASGGAKVRIGASFATAEVCMTIIGASLGRVAGALLGDAAAYIGFAALVGVGVYMIVETIRETQGAMDLSHGWGLFVAALSISLDSLGIGFSIVYIGVPFVVALVVIGVVSVCASSGGLLFGRLLGRRAEESSGVVAGVLLIATGLLFGGLHAAHIG
ncbi:MAG TPA: manganese efflux pump [Candidatus Acidoferrales bacterium]|nr:manganese efflux pump [Candidatus Acidoferrales bacterium]